ncbi:MULTISPECIES: metallophosphoesterase [Sphingomonas]|uniref:metallophosphoesterase n=1 Tax=Sphingomonas TaxID=13687 RepID=UPI000B17BE2A|nr:metallophosphoesterase [Sphingomonas sp. CCH10-B3]
MRTLRRVVAWLVLAAGLLTAFMVWQATADPVVRRLTLNLPDWPAGTPPMRLVLISDLHVAGPETPPARLARVVGQVNAIHPDLVLIAGDFVTEKRTATKLYGADAAIAPLAALRPKLGTIAVMGNHDHWLNSRDVHAALAKARITVLDNRAVRVGPLAIGGVDDAFTRHADVAGTVAALERIGGVPIVLSHSPDIFPQIPGSVPLTLAGHTHCGQIVLPLFGPVATASRYGERYRCGAVEEGGKRLIVTAGIGTSILPFRLGAPADLWVIEVGGRR